MVDWLDVKKKNVPFLEIFTMISCRIPTYRIVELVIHSIFLSFFYKVPNILQPVRTSSSHSDLVLSNLTLAWSVHLSLAPSSNVSTPSRWGMAVP